MHPKQDKKQAEMLNFLKRVKKITEADLAKYHSEDLLFANTVEELGEYAAARTVEKGIKNKNLRESSNIEAVDLLICALSLYFATGGKLHDLPTIANPKLDKWEKRL